MRTVGQAVVASGRVLRSIQTVGQAVVASGRVLRSIQTVGQAVVASESQVYADSRTSSCGKWGGLKSIAWHCTQSRGPTCTDHFT